MPNSVEVCNPTTKAKDESTVTVCDPAEEPEEGTVTICDEGCPDPNDVTVTISGDGTPTDGESYAASGGVPPYVWSISNGGIQATGPASAEVDTSGACGSGTITVYDQCGNSATMDVRFPTGQWVEISYYELTDPGAMGAMTFYEGALKITIVGGSRIWYLWLDGGGGCPYGDQPGPDSPGSYPRHPSYGEYREGSPTCNGGASYGFGTGFTWVYYRTERVYAWQCP